MVRCGIVIELRGGLPPLHHMTSKARTGELSPVRVGMTREAFAGQAKVGPDIQHRPILQDIIGLDVLALVTLLTGKLEVSALEREGNGGVIERRDIELDDGKIPPMVLFVAFDTFSSLIESMQPGSGCHARLNFRVALQALFVRDRLPQFMA